MGARRNDILQGTLALLVLQTLASGRKMHGYANDGCVRQIALESLDERWCCINSKRAKAFGDQNLGNRKTGPAAQVDDTGSR